MKPLVITLAQAIPGPPPPSSGLLGQLLMIIIVFAVVGIPIGCVVGPMAKRKGRDPVLWFFIPWIPFVGGLLALSLASRPDIELITRISRLEDELAKIGSLKPASNA